VLAARAFDRLLRGDLRKRSRLHDFGGNRVRLGDLARSLPGSLATTVGAKLGRPAALPWWPFAAQRALAGLLRESWRIFEFGAGWSTVWLAQRARAVVSREDDVLWQRRVEAALRARALDHARVELRTERAAYLAPPEPPWDFDLVVIDGRWRDGCVGTALSLVRPGGWILLDNSDVQDAEHCRALASLLDGDRAEVRRFVDLTPSQLTASQALLVRVAPGAP
jgi:hypothetical protein